MNNEYGIVNLPQDAQDYEYLVLRRVDGVVYCDGVFHRHDRAEDFAKKMEGRYIALWDWDYEEEEEEERDYPNDFIEWGYDPEEGCYVYDCAK